MDHNFLNNYELHGLNSKNLLRFAAIPYKNKTTNWNITYHPIINNKVNVSSISYRNNNSNDYMTFMFDTFFEYIKNNPLLDQSNEFVPDNYVAQNYNDIYLNHSLFLLLF